MAAAQMFALLALAASMASINEASSAVAVASADSEVAMNPIRKVVTLLQQMQQQVTQEGEKEKELYDKFMCYCKNNGGDLSASIEQANTKMPALQSDISSSEERLTLTKEQLKTAQEERSAAKKAMAEATALREKEAAAFAKEKADYDANIAAIHKAISSLEKGMAWGFLQTPAAHLLKKVASDSSLGNDEDRQTLLAFLSGSDASQYAPQSGEITGILKELGDEMEKTRAEMVATEDDAIKTYGELMAAKKKEVAALTEAIESKSKKIGDLGVSVAQMKNDLTDTEEALIADKKFLAELEKGCSTKTAEWEERKKTRAEELVAIADTIKVLNDDDALELFKKTLPSASSSSFVQVRTSSSLVQVRALNMIQAVRGQAQDPSARTGLDLIALALRGKKVGFEKVITMIDKMVATLKQEQLDDDHKKEYCGHTLDAADDKKKDLEHKVEDSKASAEAAEEGVEALGEESGGLRKGIKALDKAVAEATEDRKAEHSEFSDLIAHNSAAKELLGYAKNRLNKFYNPKLYKAPPKQELSAQDRISVNMGGEAPTTPPPDGIAGTGIAVLAQISAHDHKDAPPPPPSTFGAYSAKGEENVGVIGMMNLLIKDLDKEMTEAETSEKDAQMDYEAAMRDAAAKRAADSKALAGKEGQKADLEAQLESYREAKAATGKELMATVKYIESLHSECDWLLQYFDARRQARSDEVDALGKAKAVLSGADFSLLQTVGAGSGSGRGFLRATGAAAALSA